MPKGSRNPHPELGRPVRKPRIFNDKALCKSCGASKTCKMRLGAPIVKQVSRNGGEALPKHCANLRSPEELKLARQNLHSPDVPSVKRRESGGDIVEGVHIKSPRGSFFMATDYSVFTYPDNPRLNDEVIATGQCAIKKFPFNVLRYRVR